MTRITTQYKTNASGKGQILAKGGGKQRTVNYDHGAYDDRNHGEAAGTLALALGLSWSDEITHEVTAAGRHVFTFPA